MPDVGCEVTPTIPTMRAATATNRRPNNPTPHAHTMRGPSDIPPARTPGTSATIAITVPTAAATNEKGRSRSVGGAVARPFRSPRRPTPRATADRADPIVGSAFSTVTIPATATAPAPM